MAKRMSDTSDKQQPRALQGARRLAEGKTDTSDKQQPRFPEIAKRSKTVDSPEIAKRRASSSSSACFDARQSVLAMYGVVEHMLPTEDSAISVSSGEGGSELGEAESASEKEVEVGSAAAEEAKEGET